MEPVEPTEILLIFRVGTMHIGASVDSIVSIITPPATIPLPTSSGDAIRVFSHHNEPALAIELHRALGISVAEDTLASCIILTRLQDKLIGFRIDEATDMAQPETYRITNADPEVWLPGGPFDYVCERDDTMILHTTFEKLGEYSNGLSGEIWSAASHARLDQIEELAEAEKIKQANDRESELEIDAHEEKEEPKPEPEEQSKQTEPDEIEQLQADHGEEESVSEPVVPPETTIETVSTPDVKPPKATPDLPEPARLAEKPVTKRRPPTPAPKRKRAVPPPVNHVAEKVRIDTSAEDRPSYQANISAQHSAARPNSRWPYVVLLLLFVVAAGGWWLYDSVLISSETSIKTASHGNADKEIDRSQPEARADADITTLVNKNAPDSVNPPLAETEAEVRIETDDFTIVVERNQQNISAPEPITVETTAKVDDNVIVHIVVKGDTLWHIARRYIGDPFRYPELARLSQIKDPDWIYPGNIVRITKK